jgi:hypothetical protein
MSEISHQEALEYAGMDDACNLSNTNHLLAILRNPYGMDENLVREARLQAADEIEQMRAAVKPFAELVANTSGRIPYEKLSAAHWHALVKAYGRTER